MKFSVCVKQVPDVAASIRLRDGELEVDPGRLVLNAYDASAVEEALVLREEHGGSIEVVLVGPERAQEALRKALAMGADTAVHLKVPEGTKLDSHATAQILADFYRDHEFDVIACGKQSQDSDAGLTGSMLAAMLDLPYATNAVGLAIEGEELVVTRQGDTGSESIALKPKCLVTCSNDMNDPRIPSLKGIMAAKRKSIEVVEVDAAGIDEDVHLQVVRYENIPDREPGRKLEGEIDEQVRELTRLIDSEAHVL